MVTKTEAIKNFLKLNTRLDLANLYNYSMECQINVTQGKGEFTEGIYNGHKWKGWTDGEVTWKPIRIPYKANTEPEYHDTRMTWDLQVHCAGVGMTGWDWENRVSRWVAYDFDSILGHSEKHLAKLTDEEMAKVKEEACKIPWVEVRKSTSGRGLHLYVYLDEVPTRNHHEHAALARAILGTMSALSGYSFDSKVDICGGNMWVWHKKMLGTDGLTLIKAAEEKLKEVPPNWKNHLRVIKGARYNPTKQTLSVEALAAQENNIELHEDHKKLFNYLHENKMMCSWDQDLQLLSTHTCHLQQASEDLGFRGVFETDSPGSNLNEQNCFAFPIHGGGWSVRRYSQGASEHVSWDQDTAGWTRTYLNKDPDIHLAARTCEGLEDDGGTFVFPEAKDAIKAAELLGIEIKIPKEIQERQAYLTVKKDGRLKVEIDGEKSDDKKTIPGFLYKESKRSKNWSKIYNASLSSAPENDGSRFEEVVRHTVSELSELKESDGWYVLTGGEWQREPREHVKAYLSSYNLADSEIKEVLGNCIRRSWTIVNLPFQPQYPGSRQWNLNAAKLKYSILPETEDLKYPHWEMVLNHCGKGLDHYIQENLWCKQNNIFTGGDYLKYWVAYMFQRPAVRMPFLFFYGRQNSGKSTFHEAISTLMTRGVMRADNALKKDFNGQLENAVLCVIEETNLSKEREQIYNKLKAAITDIDMPLNKKYKTERMVKNYTHWVQCSNQIEACVVGADDSRITVCYVNKPEQEIIKEELLIELEKEAQAFLTEVMSLELPKAEGRLALPIIESSEKMMLQKLNTGPLENFVATDLVQANGHYLKFDEMFAAFKITLPEDERQKWTKENTFEKLDNGIMRGRKNTGEVVLVNVWWKDRELPASTCDVYTIDKNHYLVGRKLESQKDR